MLHELLPKLLQVLDLLIQLDIESDVLDGFGVVGGLLVLNQDLQVELILALRLSQPHG
jgi:hypothetical protein